MSPTVALTGASGFIGGVIARHARAAGWRVRGLVRSSSQATTLHALGAESVRGNIHTLQNLAELVQDCQVVIHCAAALRGTTRKDFYPTNVRGVSNLIRACLSQPLPPRIVLVSSLAAREPSLSPYAWSKREGEAVLIREATGIAWSIFRPPAVYGPQDRALRPLFHLLRKGIGLQLGPSHAKFSLIYVDDFAQAVLHWIKKGEPVFQTFEIDDGYPGGYTWNDVFRIANPHLRHCIHIPSYLLKSFGRGNEILSRLRGVAPLFTRGKAAELLHSDWVCDTSHIPKTLGWEPQISLEEGLRRLFTSDRLMPS